MAEIIGGGEPVNDSERAVIRHLRDHSPDDWYFWHNIDVPLQDGRKGDIDVLLVTGHAIYLIDVKGTRGRIEVARQRWYPSNRQAFYSPVDKLRNHVRAFKGHLTSHGLDSGIFVDQLVVLTAPDARLIDSGTGNDTDAMHVVVGFDNLVPELDKPDRVRPRFLRDIRPHRQQIIRTVDGTIRPRIDPLRFGHWQVTESLGESGEVAEYRARNVNSNDPAAPPVMLRVYRSDPFQDESIRAANRVAISNAYHMLERVRFHDCVVPCRDFFPNDDESQFVLVLEDVTAGALFLRLTDPQRALTADEKVRVIRDMLRGLAYVHAHGVLHRALSPATVLVTSTGAAMLTGFDYARPEASRSLSQSVVSRLPEALDEMYVAPECQSDPQAMSTASDVYAAGVIAFHVLTGEPPFATSVDQHLRESILPDAPMTAAGLPQSVVGLLRRMCARNSEHRPAAAAALEALSAAPEPSPDRQRNDYRNLPERYQLTRKYTVRRAIGRGTFGTVYQVYDNLAAADRAVKIVDRDHVSLVARTQQEYQTLLRLPPHENVVKVENADYLDDTGVPYLVFEYLDGKDVSELVKTRTLGAADTIRLGVQVANGLNFLHEHGVIHCDIKPGNLLWTNHGCKIIDFNVAVTEESSLSHAGGTAKYSPPDMHRSAPPTLIDLKDRDVYGLGVTLYQVLTGRFPFPSGAPQLGEAAVDPRSDSDLKDLSDEVVTTLLKAIAPLRGDRYSSAAEFLGALRAITEVHSKSTPDPVLPSPVLLPVTGDPNVNPFVAHLQSLYSQSQASNAGTRGSDAYGTYVTTALDENLIPDVLAGAYRLVIITGNAGDGKTAFLEHLMTQAAARGGQRDAPRANGDDITLPGGHLLRTNNDGSQDEGDRANDEVLKEFFAPFANGATAGHDETRLIAINEGRLVDFFAEHRTRFTALTETVRDGLTGKAPSGDIAVVNLNQRSLVAETGDAGEPGPPVFDRVLAELTSDRRWAACDTCDLVRTCYAPHNAQTFAHPSAGPKIAARLRQLYQIVHLRGQLHITLRDLRSALAYMLTSGRDCQQIHELYRTGDADQILASFYFNSWLGSPDSADRLLRLLRELDVAVVPEPALDGKLAAIGPTAGQLMMTIDQRGNYDLDLLELAFGQLRHAELGHAAGQGSASRYQAAARRRFYFECIDDDRARTALPFKSAQRFLHWISRRGNLKENLPELVAAINRGERLPDVALADGGLALATRDVPGGTVRSYRIFPQAWLSLAVADSPGNRYLESEPDGLELAANGVGGHVTTLRIRLDLFELLEHQRQGYLPSVAELQGRYLDLLIFKNELSATPYQEVVLTTGGTDAHRIRREPSGLLVMASLTEGESVDDA